MADNSQSEVTTVLADIRSGSADAKNRLVELVYEELRRLAYQVMRKERPDHTLQPTALVHEALLRLLGGETLCSAPNRAYFFAAAAHAMRQVLVDHARRRAASKRGGDYERVTLDGVLGSLEQQNMDVLALDTALDELATWHERQSKVVVLRFFGGLTMPQIAQQLEVAVGTVENDWRIAKAWLRGQLCRS